MEKILFKTSLCNPVFCFSARFFILFVGFAVLLSAVFKKVSKDDETLVLLAGVATAADGFWIRQAGRRKRRRRTAGPGPWRAWQEVGAKRKMADKEKELFMLVVAINRQSFVNETLGRNAGSRRHELSRERVSKTKRSMFSSAAADLMRRSVASGDQ